MIRFRVCFKDPDNIFTGISFQTDAQRITFVVASMEYTNPAYVGPGAYARVVRKSRKSPPTLNALFPFVVDFEGDVIVSNMCYEI